MDFDEDDDYDYLREQRRERRPSARRFVTDTRRSQFLVPDMGNGAPLSRTRSQGARPNPVIINNEFVAENYQREPSPYIPYPSSPDMRGRRGSGLGAELVDELADLKLENARLRSRSRGRSDVGWSDRRDDYFESELRRKERQLAELERKASLGDERERMKAEMELQRVKEKEERRRIEDEYERDRREEEDKKKEDEKRWRERIKQEEREKKEREEREWEE